MLDVRSYFNSNLSVKIAVKLAQSHASPQRHKDCTEPIARELRRSSPGYECSRHEAGYHLAKDGFLIDHTENVKGNHEDMCFLQFIHLIICQKHRLVADPVKVHTLSRNWSRSTAIRLCVFFGRLKQFNKFTTKNHIENKNFKHLYCFSTNRNCLYSRTPTICYN